MANNPTDQKLALEIRLPTILLVRIISNFKSSNATGAPGDSIDQAVRQYISEGREPRKYATLDEGPNNRNFRVIISQEDIGRLEMIASTRNSTIQHLVYEIIEDYCFHEMML